jgi:hypothetical protein
MHEITETYKKYVPFELRARPRASLAEEDV